MQKRFKFKQNTLITLLAVFMLIFVSILIGSTSFIGTANATVELGGELTENQIGSFSQNGIIFYDPSDCLKSGVYVGSLSASGDWQKIMNAKNADKSFFNGSGDVPSAQWSDTDTDSMKRVLETYGDLAYQLGNVIGAPWVAIIVQMRYEDANSVCGRNNFWGNGCPVGTGAGGASIQGQNLGEGFVQYGQTLNQICSAVGASDPDQCQAQFRVSDPKVYLERIGPYWVQGSPTGAGYGSIDGMKASVDALQRFIETPEGQNIVITFSGYDGSSTTSSSSSSSGGCTTFEGEYPDYDQCNPSWGSDSYGGGSICSSGCGAASMAMLATVASGQDVFPNDIADLLGAGKTYNKTIGSGMVSYDKIVGEQYGFEVESVSVNEGDKNDVYNKMKQYLSNGYMLHLSGAGTKPFSSGGHYIGIFGIDSNDNVMVADSAHGNQQYNLMDVIEAGYHGDAFSAISGGSAGGNACFGLCSSSGSATIEGGLTQEEAQALADYYNSPNVSTANLVLNRKDNCVSFSAWFVNTFAGIYQSSYGYGKDVVSNLHSQSGLEIGSEPHPFAVFSGPGSNAAWGHTGVVVGVNGDELIVIAAHYDNDFNGHPAQVEIHSRSEATFSFATPFAYTDGVLDIDKINSIIGN